MSVDNRMISLDKNDVLARNSTFFSVTPGSEYRMDIGITGNKGTDRCAFVTVMLLNQEKVEIHRVIQWIDDFSGKNKHYSVTFIAPANAHFAVLGVRVNTEGASSATVEFCIPDLATIKIKELAPDAASPTVGKKYPDFPPLTAIEEDALERNIVCLLGSPRSGSTWLGTRLLNWHEDIVEWHEPYLGYMLGVLSTPSLRLYDNLREDQAYFFSDQHKKNRLPFLRKLVLARTYSQAVSLKKKIIFKEPNGSQGADLIREAIPFSKFIFLLRDGRDVVDSLLALHKEGSWNKRPSLSSQEARNNQIRLYSNHWVLQTRVVSSALTAHNPDLRLQVKYEHLRDDTFKWLRKIYDFIEVKISDRELHEVIKKYDFKNIPKAEKGEGKFNRAASTGGWRANLNKEEQVLMHSIMRDTLNKVGYQTEKL